MFQFLLFDDPSGYGIIIRDKNGNFIDIREDKDTDNEEKEIKEINSGIYIINNSFLFEALKSLKADNSQKEYYLTDVIGILRKSGKKVCAYCVKDPLVALGVNSKEQLKEIEQLLKAR